jgi:parvulin-like peptidyl-prolyl isomerase
MRIDALRAGWLAALIVGAALAPTACAPAGEEATPALEQQALDENGLPVIDEQTPLPDPLPRVAARVDGQDVPTRNVVILAEGRLKSGQIQLSRRVYAYRQALQEILARELLFQEALRKGVEADARALEQAYDEARAGHRDDASWEEFLKGQGLDEEGLRTELRIQHTINALVAQLLQGRDFDVSDEEARAFYEANPAMFQTGEQISARHIQLRVPEEPSPEQVEEVRARVKEIRTRIVEGGEDFAELAKEHSEDPGSAGRGGQLQLFFRGQMPKPLEEVAFSLEPGQVSEVFRTDFGFHLLKLGERVPGETRPFETVREPLRERLEQRARQKAVQDFVAELRRKARIETFL